MLSTVLEAIGSIWLLVCMSLALFLLVDIAAERLRRYRRERAAAKQKEHVAREFAKLTHPMSWGRVL